MWSSCALWRLDYLLTSIHLLKVFHAMFLLACNSGFESESTYKSPPFSQLKD